MQVCPDAKPHVATQSRTGAASAAVKQYSHVPPHARMLPSDENRTGVHYTGITAPASIRGAEETKLANPPELLKLEKRLHTHTASMITFEGGVRNTARIAPQPGNFDPHHGSLMPIDLKS